MSRPESSSDRHSPAQPARLRDAAWFWAVLRHYAPLYGHVLLAALIINILSLTMPLFIMNVYDRVIPNKAFESLWVLSLGAMLAYGMDFVLRNARTYFVDLAGRNADVLLLGRFMDVFLDMRYDGPRSAGAMVAQTREFEYLREFFASSTLLAIVDTPFVLLFIALIFALGGWLALIPLLALPCMLAFALLVQWPFQQAAEAQLRHNMGKNSLLVEIAAALETIKAAQLQEGISRRWDKVVDAAAVANMQSRRLGTLAGHCALLISVLLNIILVICGVYSIAAGQLSMGALIACVILMGRIMGPLMQLAGLINQLQKARLALKTLHVFMLSPLENPPLPVPPGLEATPDLTPGLTADMTPDMGPDMKAVSESAQKKDEAAFSVAASQSTIFAPALDVSVKGRSLLQADLAFENVHFRYPGQDSRQWALHNVTLRVAHGEHVGVLGATGSGKSTLARLALGLYPPSEGSVLLGQADIRRLPMRAVRSRMGFLPQEVCLFSGTLRDNLTMAWPSPPPEDALLRAAELAGVLDFARSHPLGLDMPLGERGAGLSGGQAQSVALARALAREPEICILDEPTSNLDEAAEQRLKQRLKVFLQGRSLILFTHRLSMLELVDRVVVLQEGRVTQDGPIAAVVRPT